MGRDYIPHLFIDVGATGAMFTLRETYLHTVHIPGEGPAGNAVVNGVYQGSTHTEERSFHLRNLGQDPDEALAKASAIAAERGLRLSTTREGMAEALREIRRRSADEVLAAELARRLAIAEERDAGIMLALARRPVRVLDHPKHDGESIADVARSDRSFLEWLAGRDEQRVPLYELRRLYVETWLENHPAPVARREHLGRVGERLELDVEVLDTRLLESHPDQWPATSKLLVKMIDEAGHVLTTFYSGYEWRPKAGEAYRIRATVKDHREFRGQAETLVNRIKAEQRTAA